ncbi:hypothetical protein AVEN_10405-1 [Araneus ventricosus]|uniref:Uncharacterized protein n=1 Tax=Araneus ventricosus TaxID=182803 RepID=A0A4Y1ZJK6_ARAVE|nr:hypothetical protein AVEN_85085-1 [Araneus ventricosus]GBO41042.1 hypothetical protein AVEN_10405-1 [Araneus ventricosus]
MINEHTCGCLQSHIYHVPRNVPSSVIYPERPLSRDQQREQSPPFRALTTSYKLWPYQKNQSKTPRANSQRTHFNTLPISYNNQTPISPSPERKGPEAGNMKAEAHPPPKK